MGVRKPDNVESGTSWNPRLILRQLYPSSADTNANTNTNKNNINKNININKNYINKIKYNVESGRRCNRGWGCQGTFIQCIKKHLFW